MMMNAGTDDDDREVLTSSVNRSDDWAAVTLDRAAWCSARDPPISAREWAKPASAIEDPTWEEFFFEHLVPNVPCVFGPRLSAEWPIFRTMRDGGWVTCDDDHKVVDIDAVMHLHGGPDTVVPVSHCAVNPVATDTHDSYHTLPCEMRLGDFADHLKKERQRRSEAEGEHLAASSSSPPPSGTLLYLKDWHMLRDLPVGVPVPHDTPFLFRDDYLNEYSIATRADDYRFAYLGPRGTRTLLHTDVLGSHSWTTSIVGRKRWVFFPPEVRSCLEDVRGQFVEDVIHKAVDNTRFPRYAEAEAQRIELVQVPGQTIFVPSGWPHQVENLDECLSVNANWVNASNLDRLVSTVCEDLAVAQREIADVREAMHDDWHASCHRMVRVNCGFDLDAVCELIATVHKRITSEYAAEEEVLRDKGHDGACSEGRLWYKRFELVALRGALKTVLERWADALDPDTSIPHQYTALASTLDEQCSHFLDKSQPHSFT